jgi:hypothetical protein
MRIELYRNCVVFGLMMGSILICAGCSSQETGQDEAVQRPALEPTPAASGKPDPCTLVSKAEVEQVLGHEVGDPTINPSNRDICDFTSARADSIGFMIRQPGPSETPDRIMAELKERNIPVTEASGIGDRAFFASHGYGMTQLNAFKRNHYVILTLMIPDATEERTKSIAEELMRKALAKL